MWPQQQPEAKDLLGKAKQFTFAAVGNFFYYAYIPALIVVGITYMTTRRRSRL